MTEIEIQKEIDICPGRFYLSEELYFDYVFPWGDDTHMGTIAAIKEGSFQLDKIKLDKKDVFLDIGCNIGLLSCVVAKLFPLSRVLAFDASSISHACAKVNALKNNLINIDVYHKAIGREYKRNQMFLSNGKEISTISKKLDSEKRKDFYLCNVITLGDIFDSHVLGIDNIKYMKVDVEGDEYDIIDYLFDERPDILERIEFLHLEIHRTKDIQTISNYENKVNSYFGKRRLN